MKEIERVVTEKDHFDNRNESFLISTFRKRWKIKILMQGSISKVFEWNTPLRIQDFFRNTHLILKKKTRICNVLRNFTIAVAFYGKLATLSDSQKTRFSFETPIYLWKKTRIWKVLRNFTISVAIYGKFKTIGWIKIWQSNTWTSNIGLFMRAWSANLG